MSEFFAEPCPPVFCDMQAVDVMIYIAEVFKPPEYKRSAAPSSSALKSVSSIAIHPGDPGGLR